MAATPPMSVSGVGIVFGALTGLICGLALPAGRLIPGGDVLEAVPDRPRMVAAAVLSTGGVVLWLRALRMVIPAYHQGRLVTTGPYRLCRHPVYGAWICLLIPAGGLASGSVSLILAAVALYVVMGQLVRREEAWLTERFGDAHARYRAVTPLFLPVGGWLLRSP